MHNILVGAVELLLSVVGILTFWKIGREKGIYAWIGIAAVLAQIQTCMCYDFFGYNCTMGTVMFSSIFLAVDVLHEYDGNMSSIKGAIVAGASTFVYMLFTQVTLAFTPGSEDVMYDTLSQIFTLSFRVSAASLFSLVLANLLNIYVFDKIKKRYPNALWLRSGVSTILTNCGENYIFGFVAFVGVLPMSVVFSSAWVGALVEAIVCIATIPTLYLAKRI